MKKLFLSILVCVVMFRVGNLSVFAQTEDNQIIDAIEQIEARAKEQQLKDLQGDLSFDQFSSCDEMSTVLENFVKENFKESWGSNYRRGGPAILMNENMMMEDGFAAPTAKSSASAAKVSNNFSEKKSSTNDFSTTNTQVDGVDEADILKTDGTHLYYYNQREHKIFVIKSPLNIKTSMIDLDNAEVVKEINMPKNFNGSQMYLSDGKLVILAQRRRNTRNQSFLNRNAKTDVIVYDVKDPSAPKLLKLSDLDGNYHDSRMIGGKLYIVSQLNVNRWYGPQVFESIDDVSIDSNDFLPKVIDISYTKNDDHKNLAIGNKKYPYHVGVKKASCENINYILPSKESIKKFGMYPSFTIIRMIDLHNLEKEPETTTAFGNTQTIHMSKDSLYLTDPIYTDYAFSCPVNAKCILPWFESGQNTLIHKFNLGSTVKYTDSTVVNGIPLTQYSMSEDNHGYFRILTKNWNPKISTNLYILDDTLDLKGMLMNIEPGEEFKSSRYIGDKLYLVTFKRTDPLFVIDLDKTKKPKVIGKLVIPGFSSYLHPYAEMVNGKQYLIGLGNSTEENKRGGTVTAGIKLDLYEVDYKKKDAKGNVSTKQLYTKTRGSKNSTTEALYNPRMFVWDAARKIVVLPMILSETQSTQNCNIVYNDNGEEIAKNCRDNERYNTIFAGLKAIKIERESGISEKYSYNYIDQLKNDKTVYTNRDGTIYPWQFTQLQFRVGYLGEVLYTLNNLFANFRVMGDDAGKNISLSSGDKVRCESGGIQKEKGVLGCASIANCYEVTTCGPADGTAYKCQYGSSVQEKTLCG